MALEPNVDRDLCVQAADRALAYLRERVLDATWVAHRDIAYYFKAPQAFLLAGLRDEAAAAFDALEPFLDEGGAASGSAAYRLAYPHYPYMWAAKAARELGRLIDRVHRVGVVGESAVVALLREQIFRNRARRVELAAATQPVSLTVAGF